MNVLGEPIMEGPVTIGLVSICFGVCFVVVSVFAFIVSRFQTKSDAEKAETLALERDRELKAQTTKAEEDALLREKDMKDWIRKVESDVSRMQSSLERIGENVSYIRGRLDPTKSKED